MSMSIVIDKVFFLLSFRFNHAISYTEYINPLFDIAYHCMLDRYIIAMPLILRYNLFNVRFVIYIYIYIYIQV